MEGTTLKPYGVLEESAGIAADSIGQLNLRDEIVTGLKHVRQQHVELQGLMHQVMRRVALPRAKAIGEELIRIQGFYPKSKRGPGGGSNGFYRDCEAITDLKAASVKNYVLLAKNWHRLMDYMCELPEGASPITSFRGALDAIRAMNKGLRPGADAVDVEATEVAPEPGQLAGVTRRTHYAAHAKQAALPAIQSLLAVSTLSEKHRNGLVKIQEALTLLLDQIDAEEAEAAEVVAAPSTQEPEWIEEPVPPVVDVDPVAVQQDPDDTAPKAGDRTILKALYPTLADLEQAIAEQGSGAAVGKQAGLKRARQAVNEYLKWLRARAE